MKVAFLMLCLLLFNWTLVNTHVSLTFPPARKYELDFLDNSRTKAPCGMPKGNIKTSFLTGSTFNVSWHLGYPHRGGFKIQLLDELERPVLDLTPTIQGTEYVSTDATAQTYQVQLPANFVCSNCSLRLIRQALEWGANYKFWSCADVDIKLKKDFRETCSGHGKYLLGRCKCDRLYYGSYCQFRNECVENSDCGDHGKCIDVKATTAPRQQCYCELGYFGPGCVKRSPVKNTNIDFGIYTKKKLSDTFNLYWRIIKEHNEIEAIMVVNGTGYAGIGWRPKDLTKTCKNFPLIEESKSENIKQEAIPEFEPTKIPSTNSFRTTAEPEPGISEPEPGTAEPGTEKPEPGTAEPQGVKFKKTLYNRRSAPSYPALLNVDIVETSISSSTSSAKGRKRRETTEPPNDLTKPEPTSDPNFESNSEPNSEPNSELNTEPNTEPKSEPNFQPISKVTTNSKNTSPEKKNESVSKVFKKGSLNSYTPRHDFNPMDCTDMIIGSARGTASRIADYYTRDRSTPKMDNFWGGKNDLIAAMGFEKDGVTTILFRRKLKATDQSDHSIVDELMHVIFAQGQEKGKYKHVPKSGVESDNASEKDFYKQDELKYHGHGSHRGAILLNFLEETTNSIKDTSTNSTDTLIKTNDYTECGGHWKYPRKCNLINNTCEYSAKWQFFSKKDEVKFTITTRNTDTWTGIAFSNDEKMSQTDAIIGWVDKSGRPFLMDTWITGYTHPLLDESQNIYNISGKITDGLTTLTFARKRKSSDPKDLSFTDEKCLYIMFPIKGGIFNSVNKKLRKHEILPTVSSERICIRSCGNDEQYDLTTTESPSRMYNVEIKLIDLGENFVIPAKGSLQYEDLSKTVETNFNELFKKLPGYRRIMVENLKDLNNNIVALINLEMDKMISENNQINKKINDQVYNAILSSVETGRIGNLKVDSQYLVFDQPSGCLRLNFRIFSAEDVLFRISSAVDDNDQKVFLGDSNAGLRVLFLKDKVLVYLLDL
ncbi:unnamed protein product [Brassicogethes aeneus]|uniref:Uncharacterized protein n=1 Tax=Brassicogethes aeneus TaxID=1431903 RepID=A0A9P0AZA8_BRAAE|nr:unnamed protein product [Brassicogethes aeneus]